MVSTVVSKWCEMDFVPQYGSPGQAVSIRSWHEMGSGGHSSFRGGSSSPIGVKWDFEFRSTCFQKDPVSEFGCFFLAPVLESGCQSGAGLGSALSECLVSGVQGGGHFDLPKLTQRVGRSV